MYEYMQHISPYEPALDSRPHQGIDLRTDEVALLAGYWLDQLFLAEFYISSLELCGAKDIGKLTWARIRWDEFADRLDDTTVKQINEAVDAKWRSEAPDRDRFLRSMFPDSPTSLSREEVTP